MENLVGRAVIDANPNTRSDGVVELGSHEINALIESEPAFSHVGGITEQQSRLLTAINNPNTSLMEIEYLAKNLAAQTRVRLYPTLREAAESLSVDGKTLRKFIRGN